MFIADTRHGSLFGLRACGCRSTTATPAAQPSTQFPNAVGGFVIGVVVGIILARFIFKKS